MRLRGVHLGSSLNRRIAWIYFKPEKRLVSSQIISSTEIGNTTYISIISSKPVIDASGQDDQIILDELDADPLVPFVAHVKVARAIPDVPDLLVLVQVLVEELLDLGLVDGPHLLGRDGDLVPVLVPPLGGKRVDALQLGDPEVQDADLFEIRDGHFPTGVVGETLVALFVTGGLVSHTATAWLGRISL